MLGALRRILGIGRRRVSDEGQVDGNGAGAGDGDETDEDFVPSRLDASVNEAHGMGTASADQELERLEETAAELEDEQFQE